MKCHYELLGVPRDADDDTLKKAYRKLALKWHPDKNPDNIDECTQYFALLQQAYEVLSDPHERAFYDRHRDSILKGGFDDDYKHESMDIFQYFTSSCYKGFDGDKGFYSVYRNVFETLANEDYDFVDDPAVRYPSFGDASSDYDTVVGPFYGFWRSFSTARSFAWLDHYDIRDANNRFEVRAMEAENKKYRETGRTERNDQIRELAAFVRKRDPRVKAYRDMLEQKNLEIKQKQEEQRIKQIMKNQELASQYEVDEEAEEAHRAHLRQILDEQTDGSCDEEENEEGELFPFCVACDKSFKTANQLRNHENSKQHKKQLAELRRHMKEEDAALFDKSDDQDDDAEQTTTKKGKKAKRKARKNKKAQEEDDESDDEREADEAGNGVKVDDANGDAITTQMAATTLDDGPSVNDDEVDDSSAPSVSNSGLLTNLGGETNLFLAAAEAAKTAPVETKTKKKRRADKKKVVEEEPTAPVVDEEHEHGTGPKTDRCHKCGEFFESRSRLFDHLKQTGHASLKGAAPPPPPKNKKGRRKGGKRDDDSDF